MKVVIFIFLSILELIYCQGNSDLGSVEKLFPSIKQTLTAANDNDDQKLKAFLESFYSPNEKGQNGTTTSDNNNDGENNFKNNSLIDIIFSIKNEETTTFDYEEVYQKLKAFLESPSSDNEMRLKDSSITSEKDEDEEKLKIFLEKIVSNDEWLRSDSTTTAGSNNINQISAEDKEEKLKRVIEYIFPNPNKERKDSSTKISVKFDDDKQQIDRPITNSKTIIFPDDFRYSDIKSQLDEVSTSTTTDKFDHRQIYFPRNN